MRVVVRALVRVVAVAQVATRKIPVRVARVLARRKIQIRARRFPAWVWLARRFHHGAVVAVVVAVAKRIEWLRVCRELRALRCACY